MKRLFLFSILIISINSFSQSKSKEERQRILDEKKKKIEDSTKVLFLSNDLLKSENYTIEQKTITGVFEVEGKTKSELYSLINRWISINYNSANNVIQMNDKESGTIIVKGINELFYESQIPFKRTQYVPSTFGLRFRHLIEINIQDNRYRVIYKIIDLLNEEQITYGVANSLIFNCINFSDNNDIDLIEYNEIKSKLLNDLWVGKNKRELVLSQTLPMFEEMNEKIKLDIYIKIKSLEDSVLSSKGDKW